MKTNIMISLYKERHLVYLVFMLIFFSCDKQDISDGQSPTITFESITPNAVSALQEAITIRCKYMDPDADIGSNDTSAGPNLFIRDSRNEMLYSYRLNQLGPDGFSQEIEGYFNLTFDSLAMISSEDSEKGTFSVYLTDREGNKSNEVVSSEFSVSK